MFVEIQNIKIYYERQGNGVPIILVHGHGESTYIWRYNLKGLAEKFSVYALDLKGFGESEKPLKSDYSILAMSELILQFMDKLQIKNAILACHSFAGKIGISAIISHPDRFLGLILLGSAVGKFDIWSAFAMMKHKKIGRMALKKYNYEIAEKTLKRLHHTSYKITEEDIEKFLKVKEGNVNLIQDRFQFRSEAGAI